MRRLAEDRRLRLIVRNTPQPKAKRLAELVLEARRHVREISPWDLAGQLANGAAPLLLDVREPAEFAAVRMAGSINVPRGVLETACDWGYDTTVPAVAADRSQSIVVICHVGNRSVLATQVMQQMGFTDVVSLKQGLRGWNDFDQPLVGSDGRVIDGDTAEALLASRVGPEQMQPDR